MKPLPASTHKKSDPPLIFALLLHDSVVDGEQVTKFTSPILVWFVHRSSLLRCALVVSKTMYIFTFYCENILLTVENLISFSVMLL